jgi:hypothetical protein
VSFRGPSHWQAGRPLRYFFFAVDFLVVDFFEDDFFVEDFLEEDRFAVAFFVDFLEDFFEVFLAGGTLPPASRASDSPIAIACFGFVTFRPLPERRRPRLNSCISSPTFSCALRP